MSRTIRTKEYGRFIEKIVKARQEAGLRQIDVANKFKRPQSYVSRMESGEYRIDVMELRVLAKIYHKPLNYFLDNNGN